MLLCLVSLTLLLPSSASLSPLSPVCFKVFDEDRDSLLSRDELSCAVSSLQTVLRENTEEETSQDLEDEVSVCMALHYMSFISGGTPRYPPLTYLLPTTVFAI